VNVEVEVSELSVDDVLAEVEVSVAESCTAGALCVSDGVDEAVEISASAAGMLALDSVEVAASFTCSAWGAITFTVRVAVPVLPPASVAL